ncbi:hypothetical protein TWF696_008769 [Orbilia brochopaga]|uniref:F-box domain-containing protein n=1 Tax=Orbilia brochopaga TaxID=3140254 RepID=A0AAV9UHQ5_9PEZI
MALARALDAFREANLDERAGFLSSFFKLLTTSAKHSLHDLLQNDKFYFDVFGNLPTEIALQVAEYLSPRSVFGLRRVAKRWNRLLSSEALARSMIRKHYWDRTDLYMYDSYIESEPCRALKNLAFKEHASEQGLYRLRKLVVARKLPGDWTECSAISYPPSLRYAVVGNRMLFVDSLDFFVIPLTESDAQIVPIPLVNKNREVLYGPKLHAGEKFVVAITFRNSRLIIWNTNGERLYELTLPSTSFMSIASSDHHVVVRDSHTGDLPNYYFYNACSPAGRMQVVEQTPSDTIARTVESEINRSACYSWSVAGLSIDERSKRVAVARMAKGGGVMVSQLSFPTRQDGKLQMTEIDTQVVPGNIEGGYGTKFRQAANAFVLAEGYLRSNVYVVASDATVSLDQNGRPAWVQKCVRPNELPGFNEYDKKYGDGNRHPFFCCGDTVYSTFFRPNAFGAGKGKLGLWRSRISPGPGFEPTVEWLSGTEEIGSHPNLHKLSVADAGFLLATDKGLAMYDWLDYDGFVEREAASQQGV